MMAKESTRWKKKWNPGLRVARCCSNCAYVSMAGMAMCGISPASDAFYHRRLFSEVCDNWVAADWAEEAYGDRLK